jgi:secreted trypsin-like serine protease
MTEGRNRPRCLPCTAVGCCLLLLQLLLVLPAASAQEDIVSNRIIGGTMVTNPSKYPYYIEWEDAKCGASLIHDDSK